jgi:hypothetical protein
MNTKETMLERLGRALSSEDVDKYVKNCYTLNPPGHADSFLSDDVFGGRSRFNGGFIFMQSPEGHEYWMKRKAQYLKVVPETDIIAEAGVEKLAAIYDRLIKKIAKNGK